jgi:hypothetical protein
MGRYPVAWPPGSALCNSWSVMRPDSCWICVPAILLADSYHKKNIIVSAMGMTFLADKLDNSSK